VADGAPDTRLQDDRKLPKDNGKAIRNVCRQFIVLCQQLDLFSDAVVAIDGSKFKAVNSSDRNFTSAKLKRRMEEIEANINRYLAELDTADRHEPATAQARSVRLNDKISALKSQMATLKEIEATLDATGETQISLTDPDARSMITRGSGIVGYNVQTAVDAKHHLIVEHEVTNIGSDRDQLSGMAKKARAAIGTTTLTAIADRGYFKGEEILACREAGIAALVPATKTSNAKADGRFDKADFIYDQQKNEYRCPAGQSLIWRFASVEKGMTNHRYWSSNCKGCFVAELARHPENGMARYRLGFARGDGMWWDKSTTYNAVRHIPTTDTKAWLQQSLRP
jgi:transposase